MIVYAYKSGVNICMIIVIHRWFGIHFGFAFGADCAGKMKSVENC